MIHAARIVVRFIAVLLAIIGALSLYTAITSLIKYGTIAPYTQGLPSIYLGTTSLSIIAASAPAALLLLVLLYLPKTATVLAD